MAQRRRIEMRGLFEPKAPGDRRRALLPVAAGVGAFLGVGAAPYAVFAYLRS